MSYIYLGVFLTSLSALAFQVALTRILSVGLWYHFAFMVISIALLGYGASGSILMLFPSLKRDPPSILPFIGNLFGLSIILSYIGANQIPFDPAKLAWDPYQFLHISLLYILLGVPFFFAGLVLALALSLFSHEAGKVYAADLTGGASGCLLALPLFPMFGEGVVVV
ncbi:MAG: SAM-dependent methyltransferase, partial [Deltaproteobacteria bacterium]|nr:SAM-dependent methyltransferase [Deltaproteobacteria bacterium]